MIETAEIQKDEVIEEVDPSQKLDLACGDNKAEGFTGVDLVKTDSVDVVHDLRKVPWPFDAESIGEARCSHFFEHLHPTERVRFMNELYRVLKPGCGCLFVTPLGLERMVQDFSHVWPPVVTPSYYYFDQEWLKANSIGHYAKLHGIWCNFEVRPLQIGVSPEFISRSDETKAFAVRHYTNAPTDLMVLMVRRDGTG